MYYSLIADIKDSKKLIERKSIQEKLKNVLNQLNDFYDENIASKLTLTIGDEFQCLFFNCNNIFEIITKIELYMYPVKFRFSIGYGNLVTNINKEQSIGSDGPVWWHARQGIDDLRNLNEKGIKEISNIKINGLKSKTIIETINIIFVLLNSIKEKWTDSQCDTIKYIINNYGLNDDIVQSKIAKETNLTPAVINKRLKNSQYYNYVLALNSIIKVLKSLED